MEELPTFYVMYRLEQDTNVGDTKLEKGYYKYTYNLSGVDIPNCCQYSKDRYEWSDCDAFNDLGQFQGFFENAESAPMKMEHEDYIETIRYRGYSVPVFCDDYGQCFYCIFNNEVLSFGSFQPEYEDEVKSLIDHEIDWKKSDKSS